MRILATMRLHAFMPLAATLVVALCLSACISVGPDHETPELGLADSWNQAIVDDLRSGAPSIETWWDVFEDPTLSAIIAHASTNSIDLKVAMARVDEAAAQAGVARSERFPHLAAQGQAQITQLSEATNPDLPPGTDLSTELYQLGIGVGWEIDLWGRVRRSVESAEASYEASLEDHRDTLVILYAAIASAYVDVRTLQQRIDYAEKNVEIQVGTLTLTENRYKAGLSSRLDVWQAELNLASTRALIPSLRAQSTVALNRLGVLAGDEPSSLWALLGEKMPIPDPPKDVMVGLPVDLLRQRPDVRAAERRLAAQNARIGVARAQLYPTFTLPGSFILQSLETGDLLKSSSLNYGFGPEFRWALFNGGAVRRSIEIEEARTAQANPGRKDRIRN